MVASSSSKVSIKKRITVLVLKSFRHNRKNKTKENILGQVTGNTVNSLGLDQILSGIQKAKDNDDIKGIYIEAGLLKALVMPLFKKVRNALLDFKKFRKMDCSLWR